MCGVVWHGLGSCRGVNEKRENSELGCGELWRHCGIGRLGCRDGKSVGDIQGLDKGFIFMECIQIRGAGSVEAGMEARMRYIFMLEWKEYHEENDFNVLVTVTNLGSFSSVN